MEIKSGRILFRCYFKEVYTLLAWNSSVGWNFTQNLSTDIVFIFYVLDAFTELLFAI